MSSGGARNRNGAVIDPNSGRSDRRGIQFFQLPASGFDGEAPEFPIPDDAGDETLRERELDIWWESWKTPQAAAWIGERWRWRIIAEYCRISAIVELSIDPGPGLVGQLHRFRDQIGLTPAGLSENGWQIAPPEASDAGASAARSKPVSKRSSARDRMKVVEGGGG